MKFISLFAGIGGFDEALTRAGMSCVAQVEIDRDARRILERHFPEVPRFTDVRRVHAATVCGVGGCEWCLPACDVLCGGWPCQDLSVAGLRAGLAGDRSGLWVEFSRLVGELRPRWVFAENVPGLLSSWSPAGPAPECVDGGRWEVEETSDLGSVLSDLGELGYWWAYRILDAQHFGVPQRRERVLIVGRAGNVASAGVGGMDLGALASLPARVLFDPEGLPGNPSPRDKARARVAAGAGAGAAPGGGIGDGGVISTLQGGGRRGHRVDAESAGGAIDPVSALTHSHGGADDNDAQAGHLIVAPLTAAMGSNRGAPGRAGKDSFVIPTDRPTEEGYVPEVTGAMSRKWAKGTGGPSGDEAQNLVGALTPGAHPGSYNGQDAFTGHLHEVTHTLRSEGSDASEDGTGRGVPLTFVARYARNGRGAPNEIAVRRLTPRECERLQGFEDSWTDSDAQGKPLADSPRYRLIGNAVAVPVIEWVARRIVAVEAGLDPQWPNPEPGEST